MKDTIEGRCLCGEIGFAYSGDVHWALNCHCETCRRATSSPMTSWISVPKSNFSFVQGSPKTYSSSPGVTRCFCPNCGSQLSYENETMPDEIHLYIASLIDPNLPSPTFHVFVEEKLTWFDTHDALPRYLSTSSGGTKQPDYFGPK